MDKKKCKYCQSEIDKKAKICPNCRKKQGMPKWLIAIIVVVVIAPCVVLVPLTNNLPAIPSLPTF